MKLTKKQKAKWLKALRSGEYKQTTGTLYNEETQGFCCLGVLQHCLSGGMVEYEEWEDPEPMSSPSLDWYRDNGIHVGTTVEQYPGQTVHIQDSHESKLMNMNDGTGQEKKRGFRGIAQWIEKNIGTLD